MVLTAFDEDVDENGNRDDPMASGIVEQSPWRLRCNGSRWVLRIDRDGVSRMSSQHLSDKSFPYGLRVTAAKGTTSGTGSGSGLHQEKGMTGLCRECRIRRCRAN